MMWQEEKLGLIFEDAGTTVSVQVYSGSPLSAVFLEGLKEELIWRDNLSLDLAAFYQVAETEPTLQAVARFHGLRPIHPGSLYEYLIIAIVLQNATVRRSVTMLQALFEPRLNLADTPFGPSGRLRFWLKPLKTIYEH